MSDLVIAALGVAGVLMAALWLYRATRNLVDHTDPGRGWGASFDEFYSHPYSQGGPAAQARPGPGAIPKEDHSP